MKTTDLFQPILLFALFLCGLTACNDSDEIRLSPFQETTVKGEASIIDGGTWNGTPTAISSCTLKTTLT